MARVTPSSYGDKKYTNPYPDWSHPTVTPPITASVMDNLCDGLDDVDSYLHDNTGSYLELTVTGDTEIPIKATGHTYIILTFGNDNPPVITFTPTPSGTIIYEGGQPSFSSNSVYELSFLNLNCIWKKRSTQ